MRPATKPQVKNTLIDFPQSPYALLEHSDRAERPVREARAREVVSELVTNIVTKSAVLTAACAGSVVRTSAMGNGAFSAEGFAPLSGTVASRARMQALTMHGRSPLMARLQDQKQLQVQQLQDQQRWSVPSGTSPIALTAYPAADERRVSGPYPWRQPA